MGVSYELNQLRIARRLFLFTSKKYLERSYKEYFLNPYLFYKRSMMRLVYFDNCLSLEKTLKIYMRQSLSLDELNRKFPLKRHIIVRFLEKS